MFLQSKKWQILFWISFALLCLFRIAEFDLTIKIILELVSNALLLAIILLSIKKQYRVTIMFFLLVSAFPVYHFLADLEHDQESYSNLLYVMFLCQMFFLFGYVLKNRENHKLPC